MKDIIFSDVVLCNGVILWYYLVFVHAITDTSYGCVSESVMPRPMVKFFVYVLAILIITLCRVK